MQILIRDHLPLGMREIPFRKYIIISEQEDPKGTIDQAQRKI